MDQAPAAEYLPLPAKEKFLKGRREQVFVLVFVTLVTFLILVTVLLASYFQQAAMQNAAADSLAQAVWSISRVAPSNASSTEVDLTLTSSIGNVRHYNGVRSYGLSNSRQKLVISNANALEIVNLPEDTRTKVKPAFDYAGDQGQAISWTAKDDYFAMAVHRQQDNTDTRIVVYTSTGEVFKEFKSTLATQSIAGNTVLFPVKFSPSRNLMIARVYKSEDKDYYKSQNLTLDQLPIMLRVYNLEGFAMKDISVRDAATDGSYVTYFWDATGTYLVYKVVPANMEVNYTDEASFVKIAI